MPVQQMLRQQIDPMAGAAAGMEKSIREGFGRRGQSGTAAEAAAIRESRRKAQGARGQAQRDIVIQNELQKLAARQRALGLGASFLQQKERTDDNTLGNYMAGFLGR
tara:strand:+ start:88 stop:408 length:321 start_codon:yes stop_codon:yes gene_type:complete